MKKKFRLLTAALLLIAFGSLIPFIWRKTMTSKPVYRLKEPMLIATPKGAPYYMIPPGTVLHFQHGFDEGHQLYTIEIIAMGKLPADQISESDAEATWLDPIDADDVSRILQQYPLPKDELVRILKAKKMTRDDLAQIVREWKED
jgi:hypothetical protein